MSKSQGPIGQKSGTSTVISGRMLLRMVLLCVNVNLKSLSGSGRMLANSGYFTAAVHGLEVAMTEC